MNFTPELKPEATLSTDQGRFFANVLRKQLAAKGELPFWSKLIDEIEHAIESIAHVTLIPTNDGLISYYGSHLDQGFFALVFAEPGKGVRMVASPFYPSELENVPDCVFDGSDGAVITECFDAITKNTLNESQGFNLVYALFKRYKVDVDWIQRMIDGQLVPALFFLKDGNKAAILHGVVARSWPANLDRDQGGRLDA